MLSFILAASLVVQATIAAGSWGARWDNLLSALADAQVAVDRIGHCTTELPARRDLEADYQALLSRTVAASQTTQALNPDIDPAMESVVRLSRARVPSCTASALRGYRVAARRALAIVETGLRTEPIVPSRGLWVGTLQLCGGRVVAVQTAQPEFRGAGPSLILRFSANFALQIRALTAQRVGTQLAVVLDGRVIMLPRVNEPISNAILISGPGDLPLERIRAAAMAAC